MKEVRTEVEINAPPHRVWAILSHLARHPEWNPFIRSIEGELREGEHLFSTSRASRGQGFHV